MKLQIILAIIGLVAAVVPARGGDEGQCTGWATCSSVSSAGDYELTGGGDGSLIVLRSDGSDQRDKILNAVSKYDVIVFDGSGGDFIVSSAIYFHSLKGRTLVGVNGARFRTQFVVTQEIRDLLDALDVKSLSSNPGANLGGTLSNGQYVNEQCELAIRQALIDRFGDPKEPYRYAGVFSFDNCSNLIIRNLYFTGPGSLDVGGADLLTILGSDHVWVDHCRFTDGLDGNLDIVVNSDFVTVSDSHFRYTDKSYNHPLSNLTSGNAKTDGSPQTNNISWIRCFWDEGCLGRMPSASLGIHHILNCYWDTPGGTCIDAHNLARLLIENSYFSNRVKKAITLQDKNVTFDWRGSIRQGNSSLNSTATINVPYSYEAANTVTVPDMVRSGAGPKLTFTFEKPLSASPSSLDFGKIYSRGQAEARLSISAYGNNVPKSVTLSASEGILLSSTTDGEYSCSLRIAAGDANLIQGDVYVRADLTQSGAVEKSIAVTAPGVSFEIPVRAEVVALEGEPVAATVSWPLDMGQASATEASMTVPEAFSSATMTLGDKIYIHSAQSIGSEMFTLFNPTEAIGRAVDGDCCITLDIVTAPGHTFVPKTLKLKASRIGTDMCYIDIACSRDDSAPQNILTAYQPPRSSFESKELPLSSAGVGQTLQVKIYLYNMSVNKQLALGDIRIEGDLYATDSAIPTIIADPSAEIRYYDLQGRPVAHPRPGEIYIMVSGEGKGKLIREK